MDRPNSTDRHTMNTMKVVIAAAFAVCAGSCAAGNASAQGPETQAANKGADPGARK